MGRAVSRLTTRHDIFAVPVTSLCEGEERGGEERGGEGRRGEERGGEGRRGEERGREERRGGERRGEREKAKREACHMTTIISERLNLIYTDSSH